MIVSWNWLKDYVSLDMSHEELAERLMMAGLNHEGTEVLDGDVAIDLEVTSNRPDCLGHVGVAREVAVLFGTQLKRPDPQPAEGPTPVDGLVKVRIDCPELCFRYTARVVRGVKIGPSPAWMQQRLASVGLAAVNNVVDVSNYVMLECGQPLHTFDFAKLRDGQIVVRRPKPGEQIEAIDHRMYDLRPDMCMICDAETPVAIGGVMGGAQTEISDATTDVLIEAADFDPVSIRTSARALNLHSPSSYRFERRVDPEGIEWASRRCAELILDLAGGELAAGMVDAVGQSNPPREPIVLRLSQLKRILGIDVPAETVREILVALGCQPTDSGAASPQVSGLQPQASCVPPSWRRDLTREIDLVEEIARIYGYDKIPEDVGVPMAASSRRHFDRVLEKVRGVMTACGINEAMTYSAVDEATAGLFSPWTDSAPLRSIAPVLRGADRLRTTLIPSLLQARRTNETLSNPDAELFETAKVYLPRGAELPGEQYMVGIVSGRDYRELRGVVQALIDSLRPPTRLDATDAGLELLAADQSCRLELDGQPLGYLGQLTDAALKQFELRTATCVAELRLDLLTELANLVPLYAEPPQFPAVTRDLNFVVDEPVRWAALAATVESTGGELFESLAYQDTYRDAQRLGHDKKSLLLTVTLRSKQGTLTSQQADDVRDRIVAACREAHGAELRA